MTMLIELNEGWVLKQNQKAIEIPFSIPGDIHSTLLANKLIDDPYYRDNELSVDWVHQLDWVLEREFDLDSQALLSTCQLQLDQLDCIASIYLNNALVAKTESQFIRYCFDVTAHLLVGTNVIKIGLDSASGAAAQKAKAFPFELPYLSWNCRVPHNNMLRKTPCHAGWDWNICLMPSGIYGDVSLRLVKTHWIADVKFEQHFNGDDVVLDVSAQVCVTKAISLDCRVAVAGSIIESEQLLQPGTHELQWSLEVSSPKKWWPIGSGDQVRYPLTLVIGDQQQEHLIGFRHIHLERKPDEQGVGFQFNVNGRRVFMRGANWIPADALPERICPATVKELLQSAVDANMNMLRVWGGGQYEPDWFYELCNQMGILIWQDFMFSCNHYPAACPDWLELVKTEATQQVRRLSKHPCVALWCGDNELVGALNWWDITRENRDRYLANYSRLNHTVELCTQSEVSDTDFWPSSPSVGYMDFGDGWKNDAAGDMHFWDVWHEAKPFSAYQDIHPRFCSEFGFQSFPSMPLIETFTEARDQNVSSSVMDVHQRNVGGNARIVETLVRYFEFPDSFERMVFLSQCQQAMAIKTAVEYWRCLKPHCMGTLYWQLNDTWPVASWASLEYGGGWKLLHYAAKRFYQPLLVAIVPGHEKMATDGQLLLKVVSDLVQPMSVAITVKAHDVHGNVISDQQYTVNVEVDAAVLVDTLIDTVDKRAPDELAFYRFTWSAKKQGDDATDDNYSGENEYWLKPYKDFSLPKPKIQCAQTSMGGQECVQVSTDAAAYFVSLDLGGNKVFSDNGFTLLPGETKLLTLERVLTNSSVPNVDQLNIQHL